MSYSAPWTQKHSQMSHRLDAGKTYTQAPRVQPNLGRPFYKFANAPAPLKNPRVALPEPAVPLPAWMPEVWTKAAESPLDNTRSAVVRDLYGNRQELADWGARLRTHIQSFQKDIRGGVANIYALPPLTAHF